MQSKNNETNTVKIKEPKTAEDYRQLARMHQEAGKNQWKTFLQCGIFVIAAFIALFIFSAAWFSNNTKVGVSNGTISSAYVGFQLKTYGENGIYDDALFPKLNEILSSVINVFNGSKEDGYSEGYFADGTNSSVSWLVSSESNLGNYSETEVSFTGTDHTDYSENAIEPGAYGKLTFYIVPGNDGTQTYNLDLTITPYIATIYNSGDDEDSDETDKVNNSIESVSEVGGSSSSSKMEQYAREFIKGHILFFMVTDGQAKSDGTLTASVVASEDDGTTTSSTGSRVKFITQNTGEAAENPDAGEPADVSDDETEQNSEGGTDSNTSELNPTEIKAATKAACVDVNQLVWLKDGKVSITIENAKKDQEYEYTLYWEWPQVFSEIVLNAAADETDSTTISDPFLNGRTPIFNATVRDQIVEDMTANPNKYFYNSLRKEPLSTSSDSTLIEQIQDIHSKSPVSSNTDAEGYSAQNYVDLSSFYNQADQILGSNVSFIKVELSAVLGGGSDE